MMWRTIIFLFLALPLSGQQGMLLVGSGQQDSTFLDKHPGAIVAYSLRLLSSSYTGDCVRVVRTGDLAETDIGFLPSGMIDTNAVNTFCSARTCRVNIWYDQSGNGYDATGGSSFEVYNSVNGGLYYLNGLPTLQSTVNGLTNDTVPPPSNVSFFAVSGFNISTSRFLFDHSVSTTNAWSIVGLNSTTMRLYSATAGITSTTSSGQQITYAYSNNSTGAAEISINNGTATTGTIGTGAGTGISIGKAGNSNSFNWNQGIQEVILYHTDKSGSAASIINEINNYYSIY